MGGQDDDFGGGEFLPNGGGCLQAIHARHLDIHQDDIRQDATSQFHRFLAIAGLHDRIELRFFTGYDTGDGGAYDGRIVSKQQAGHFVSLLTRHSCEDRNPSAKLAFTAIRMDSCLRRNDG